MPVETMKLINPPRSLRKETYLSAVSKVIKYMDYKRYTAFFEKVPEVS
jgi:hypothetical protein